MVLYIQCVALHLVTQSCPTLCNSMDCSPPGSSVHGDSPDKNTGVGCHALLQGIFPTQGSNRGFLHRRWIFNHLSYQGSPKLLCAQSLHSCPTLCNPMDLARQAPLSMGFSRQEYWRGLPCLPPGDIVNPGIKPWSLMSPALAGRFFTTSATWEPPSEGHRP